MENSLYIFSDGKLKRKNNTLYFEDEDKKQYFPIKEITEIFLFGSVVINKKLVKLLSNYNIFLHIFDYYENYVGSFYPKEFNNSGKVLLSQIEYYQSKEKRFNLAVSIVNGAVNNILSNLRYYYNRGVDVEEEGIQINSIRKSIVDADNMNKLRAIEGRSRNIYYKTFDKILKNEFFKFEKRSRRPPQNPLNALISFGNVIMYSKVLQIIHETHLDPRIGYLHETNFRQFSLNLDIAEIFKPVLIDKLIFSIINKKQVGEENFKDEKGGIYLTKPGLKIFMKEFEKKLSSTITLRENDRKISYRNLIKEEIYKVEKHVLDKKKYKPYISRW